MDLENLSAEQAGNEKNIRTNGSIFQLSSTCQDADNSSFLHDSVALGNFETQLLEETLKKQDAEFEKHQQAEVERLPLFMRILSKCRPLSQVSLSSLSAHKNDSNEDTNDTSNSPSDPVLEEAVRRLEDRAAVYSVSEGVEVVSCHLAPYVSRRISKLPPIIRKPTQQHSSNGNIWDISELLDIAQNPSSSRFSQSKRRKLSSSGRAQSTAAAGGSNLEEDDYDEESETEGMPPQAMPKRKRISSSTERDSILLAAGAAEDSQEAFVTKTLSEVALSVAQYLQHENEMQATIILNENKQDKATREDGDVETGGDSKVDPTNAVTSEAPDNTLTTSIEDSILAQARVVSSTTNVGGITGSDLGATIASLFHHAPVLRHAQTAAALCRAEQPQTSHLLQRLAANCPPAIPALVKGCLRSLEAVQSHPGGTRVFSTTTQKRLAKSSVLTLSTLSQRECLRIQNTLRFNSKDQQNSALLELQLELSLQRNDPVDLACFLIQHFSCNATLALQSNPEIEAGSGQGHHSAQDIEVTKNGNQDQHGSETFHTFDEKNEKPIDLAHLISIHPKKYLLAIIQCLSKGLALTTCDLAENEGRLLLVLKACMWLLVTQMNTSLPAPGPKTFTSTLLSLLEECQNKLQSDESHQDILLEEVTSLVIACLTVWIPLNAILEETSIKSFQKVWESKVSSEQCRFRGCLALALSSPLEEPALRCFLLRQLGASSDDDFNIMKIRVSDSESKIKTWCQANLKLENATEQVLSKETIMLDPWPAAYALKTTLALLSRSKARTLLEGILFDKRFSLQMLKAGETVKFIDRAVAYLKPLDENEVLLPVVNPLHLEMQASALPFAKGKNLDFQSATYILQLIYCFSFKERYPQSPFSFDPRSVPLKFVWMLCDNKQGSIPSFTRDFLRKEILKEAPEIMRLSTYTQRSGDLLHVLDQRRDNEHKKSLKSVLISYISNKDLDPSGFKAEVTFQRALAKLSEQDITSTLASAFFREPSTPLLFLTHRKLCEDPLIIMKCPLKDLWSRPGLRRIALFLLSFLLDTNTALVAGSSFNQGNDECFFEELLAARDMLAVRSLIASSFDQSSGIDCSATIGLIRWFVSHRRGLGPFLLRQGIPSGEFDWMAARIPEFMAFDPSSYSELFSEHVSLAPVERFMVAAFVVKMVILYGQRDEDLSGSLIMSALSQLISGFFVLVGPSGVAVSALLADSDSPNMNATQLSRQAALRAIRELSNIRSYRSRIRSESSMACQKLYRLCKGEELVAGLSVSNSTRQKAALREIQDAVSKALTVVGSN